MAWWTRTQHNRGSGDLLMNDPDGWVIDRPDLTYRGTDSWREITLPVGGSLGKDDDPSALPAITRATSLICDTLSGQHLDLQRGREHLESPRWLTDPGLARPDLRVADYRAEGVSPLSAVSFWAEVLISALWYGDAFIWVPVRDNAGNPVPPLWVIHPLLVDVVTPSKVDAQRPRPGYWVETSGSQWTHVPASQVIHVRGMGPYWDGRGSGAITSHSSVWDEAASLRSYAAGIFTAGIPAGYLKVSAPNLTEEQAGALRDKWASSHGGKASRRQIAVLNSVTEFVPIQLPPETAQLAEAKRLSLLDVANAFGVEPFMLGLPADGSTYANIESRMRSFAQFTLQPWARRLESALSAEFPQGTEVRINLDSLARADSGARVAYYAEGTAGGWLTVDEIREMEGLPPLAAPDVRQDNPTPPGGDDDGDA